jgi:carbamoyl-phosphate synthase large subunit
MGLAELAPEKVPVLLEGERVISRPVTIEKREYNITACSMGNPHCVVFCDKSGSGRSRDGRAGD